MNRNRNSTAEGVGERRCRAATPLAGTEGAYKDIHTSAPVRPGDRTKHRLPTRRPADRPADRPKLPDPPGHYAPQLRRLPLRAGG